MKATLQEPCPSRHTHKHVQIERARLLSLGGRQPGPRAPLLPLLKSATPSTLHATFALLHFAASSPFKSLSLSPAELDDVQPFAGPSVPGRGPGASPRRLLLPAEPSSTRGVPAHPLAYRLWKPPRFHFNDLCGRRMSVTPLALNGAVAVCPPQSQQYPAGDPSLPRCTTRRQIDDTTSATG